MLSENGVRICNRRNAQRGSHADHHPDHCPQRKQRSQQQKQSSADPQLPGKPVRPVPVLLIAQRPGDLDAQRAVPPQLWQIVADPDKQHAQQHRHDPRDLRLFAQRSPIHHAACNKRTDRQNPENHPQRPGALALLLRVAQGKPQADQMHKQMRQRQTENSQRLCRTAVCLSIRAPMGDQRAGQPVPHDQPEQNR